MPQDPAEQIETRYLRIAITIVMMGVMMSAIDTTAVILGLPVMIGDLNSDILTMISVLLAYLLVIAILGTQVGKLGDMFGRVRMYNLGFAVFTIGSLLCGISTDGTQLVAFRALQGIGGALISSNSGAIIADTFPMKERGKAFGFTGMGFSIGAILEFDRGSVRHLPQLAIHILHQPAHRSGSHPRRILPAQGAVAPEEGDAGLRRHLPVRSEPVPYPLRDHQDHRLGLELGVRPGTRGWHSGVHRVRAVGEAVVISVPGPVAVPRPDLRRVVVCGVLPVPSQLRGHLPGHHVPAGATGTSPGMPHFYSFPATSWAD